MATPRRAAWTPRQVLIAIEGGLSARDGFVHARYPGLALHKVRPGWWTITHIDSGSAALSGCPTRAYAEHAFYTLGAAADWTPPMSALCQERGLRAIAESYVLAWDRWMATSPVPLPAEERERRVSQVTV